jgi:hypothetical protein
MHLPFKKLQISAYSYAKHHFLYPSRLGAAGAEVQPVALVHLKHCLQEAQAVTPASIQLPVAHMGHLFVVGYVASSARLGEVLFQASRDAPASLQGDSGCNGGVYFPAA